VELIGGSVAKYGLHTLNSKGVFDLPNAKKGDVVAIDKVSGSPIIMHKGTPFSSQAGWYIQAGKLIADLGDKLSPKPGSIAGRKFEELVSDCSNRVPYCSHTWVMYNSGFTTFEYCSVCDVKRQEYLDQLNSRYEKAYGVK
jgi:hypothetical protein